MLFHKTKLTLSGVRCVALRLVRGVLEIQVNKLGNRGALSCRIGKGTRSGRRL
jgi:hypothetical protein